MIQENEKDSTYKPPTPLEKRSHLETTQENFFCFYKQITKCLLNQLYSIYAVKLVYFLFKAMYSTQA